MGCVVTKIFDKDSSIYHTGITKTGVLAPFVTADGATYLFERTNEKKRGLKLTVGLHSVAGGFLDPAIKQSERDIISLNAEKEALEEILGDSEGNLRHDVSISNIQIWGVSFRYFAHTRETTVPPLATLEFVCPILLNHDSSAFEKSVLERNIAKDRHEHEAEPVANNESYSALKYVRLDLNIPIQEQCDTNKYPGKFLWQPCFDISSAVYKQEHLKQHTHTSPAVFKLPKPHSSTKSANQYEPHPPYLGYKSDS